MSTMRRILVMSSWSASNAVHEEHHSLVAVVNRGQLQLRAQGSEVVDESTGSTSLTKQLNSMIERKGNGDNATIYTGGRGILVRAAFEHLPVSGPKVLPTTFWVNDIVAPSQIYLSAGGSINNCGRVDQGQMGAETLPWNYANVGLVVGTKLNELFPNFDNVQDVAWDKGVFYAYDANSVDHRCRWLEGQGKYDCPAGNYDMGPPNDSDEQNSGGGAGCHDFEQTGAGRQETLMDKHCRCNDAFRDDWGQWVEMWQKAGHLHAPDYEPDRSICWVTNLRDMISMQNHLYWSRRDWNDGVCEKVAGDRAYWGWNEVPVSAQFISNTSNWDAVMIKLPTTMKGEGESDTLSDLQEKYLEQLEKDLISYVQAGYLAVGEAAFPRSSLVIVREFKSGSDYLREFFCQNVEVGKFKVVMQNDKCFLDRRVS